MSYHNISPRPRRLTSSQSSSREGSRSPSGLIMTLSSATRSPLFYGLERCSDRPGKSWTIFSRAPGRANPNPAANRPLALWSYRDIPISVPPVRYYELVSFFMVSVVCQVSDSHFGDPIIFGTDSRSSGVDNCETVCPLGNRRKSK